MLPQRRRAARAFREDDPLGGDDPYSASKAAQEHVAAAYRALGLPLATVRAGNVIGGGDWARGPARGRLHARRAGRRAGDRPRAGRRAAVAARALPARGLPAVAERPLAGDAAAASAWNFGPATTTRARRLARRARRAALARRARRRAARAGDAAAGEAPLLRLDSTRARERLGWAPRWDLEAGLDATVAWYAAYRDGADMRAETLGQIAAYERA